MDARADRTGRDGVCVERRACRRSAWWIGACSCAIGVMIGWLTMVVAVFGRARGLAQAIGLLATFAAVFAIVLGPQMLRIDLRQDLQHLELLKTWPVRAAAVVRGEMLWPAAVITTLAWVLGVVGIVLSAATFSTTTIVADGLPAARGDRSWRPRWSSRSSRFTTRPR